MPKTTKLIAGEPSSELDHQSDQPREPTISEQIDALTDPSFMTSLARGLAVLQAFSDSRKPQTIANISQKTGIPRAASMGPEWHAISAALKGDEKMEAFQHELIDSYVDIYCDVFAPYCSLPKKELRLRCVGIIGAAEAITREMQRGRVAASAAATAIASLMVSWLPA
eukprot:gene27219-33909_t